MTTAAELKPGPTIREITMHQESRDNIMNKRVRDSARRPLTLLFMRHLVCSLPAGVASFEHPENYGILIANEYALSSENGMCIGRCVCDLDAGNLRVSLIVGLDD